MMTNQAERKILNMIEEGQLTAEEGLRLINAMEGGKKEAENEDDGKEESISVGSEDVLNPSPIQLSEKELQRMKKLKRWWVLPFGLGLLVMTLGAIWMYSAYMNNGFGFGFWLAWLPFFLGVAIIAISFQSARSVWLHVRIKQKPGEKPEKINISLPLPITLARWVFITFGNRIPGIKEQPVDAFSDILDNLSPEEPFYVHVQEDDGEEVEVFIG
jgi:hypothetical protein